MVKLNDHKILNEIEWVFFDIDGVMTDGRLYYGPNGEEFKVFNVKDGLGLKLLKEVGVKLAVISGRGNKALAKRLNELSFDIIIVNRNDKGKVFDELKSKIGSEIENSICVGDDLPDLELFDRCRMGFAVFNAMHVVKEKSNYVLTTKGGHGAVRELCDMIVEAKQQCL